MKIEKEDQIIQMLEEIIQKQDEHSHILEEHSQMLNAHSRILQEHSKTLDEHGQKLDTQSTQLLDHGQILSALRSDQEYIKAELDGMKLANAKEFGNIKEEISILSTNQELMREESWKTKVDVHRMQKTMGMK